MLMDCQLPNCDGFCVVGRVTAREMYEDKDWFVGVWVVWSVGVLSFDGSNLGMQ